jgi:hypothetical protein
MPKVTCKKNVGSYKMQSPEQVRRCIARLATGLAITERAAIDRNSTRRPRQSQLIVGTVPPVLVIATNGAGTDLPHTNGFTLVSRAKLAAALRAGLPSVSDSSRGKTDDSGPGDRDRVPRMVELVADKCRGLWTEIETDMTCA